MKADKDYYLDENEKLTTDEGKAAFLLIRKGQDVAPDVRDKYGIGKETKQASATENKKK